MDMQKLAGSEAVRHTHIHLEVSRTLVGDAHCRQIEGRQIGGLMGRQAEYMSYTRFGVEFHTRTEFGHTVGEHLTLQSTPPNRALPPMRRSVAERAHKVAE
jgi:hypothetical protein